MFAPFVWSAMVLSPTCNESPSPLSPGFLRGLHSDTHTLLCVFTPEPLQITHAPAVTHNLEREK